MCGRVRLATETVAGVADRSLIGVRWMVVAADAPILLFDPSVLVDVPGFVARLLPRFFWISMWVGSALITASSVAYFDFATLPPFVIEKLPVRFEPLWLTSLRLHVASALLSFPLCLLLMTRWLQRRQAWHRW